MRPGHDRVARLALALTIIIGSCSVAAAAELAIPPRGAPKASNVSMQAGPPNCRRWTDSCVNCSRGGKDEAAVCSNIGFACQPKAIRCLSTQ